MLPTPPTPARPWLPAWWSPPCLPLASLGWLRRPRAALLALLLGAVVGLGLAGCSGIGQPSQGVLLRALGLQIALTQRSIASALALEPAGLPQVSRVRVERQEEVAIADGSVLLPATMSRVDGMRREIRVAAVYAEHFAKAPRLKNPQQVTFLEEDKICGFFGGGYLYAHPSRVVPLL